MNTSNDEPLLAKHQSALGDLRSLLISLSPGFDDVAVYAFYDEDGGFRIAEIDFMTGNGGASYMREIPGSEALLFRCEQFVLMHAVQPFRPEGWTEDIDERDDARLILCDLMQSDVCPAASVGPLGTSLDG